MLWGRTLTVFLSRIYQHCVGILINLHPHKSDVLWGWIKEGVEGTNLMEEKRVFGFVTRASIPSQFRGRRWVIFPNLYEGNATPSATPLRGVAEDLSGAELTG